jgi:hypothetical protein
MHGVNAGDQSGDVSRKLLVLLRENGDPADLLEPARQTILGWRRFAAPPADAGLIVSTLAALRPGVITPEIGDALREVVRTGDLSRTWQPELDEAFVLLGLLIPTPARAVVLQTTLDVLRAPNLHRRWFRDAMLLLSRVIDVDPALVTVVELLDVAESRETATRDALLRYVVAPHILAEPATMSVDILHRFERLQSEPQRARYLFAAVTDHAAATPEARQFARDESSAWFPLREPWRHALGTSTPRILCVQNIADGQGDEIVRVVPLLQALLDGFPDARATVITDRGYLYRHSRIETISFDEPNRIGLALEQPCDVLIEFDDPEQLHLNHDPELIELIETYRTRWPTPVDLTATKGWNRFTVDRLLIGGMDWAAALTVDRPTEANVYDPAFRLIAELGLPLRIGEQPSHGEPILTGGDRPSEVAAWERLTAGNTDARPVALLNPFGGSAMLKGFTHHKIDDLAALIQSMVDEDYFVLACPSGQPWGSTETLYELIDRMSDSARKQVAVVPGATPKRDESHSLAEVEPPISPAEFIQQLISFVSLADLVVTVEGWMMHVAYLLGRPYRLLTLPASMPITWQPWGRSARQRRWLFAGDPALDRIPLPEQPRKRAWIELLRRIDSDEWVPFLQLISRSEDPEIREAVVRAMGRIGDQSIAFWLAEHLDDQSHRVIAAAATALLDRHRDVLGAGRIPNGTSPDWTAASRIKERALPAFEKLLHVDDPVIRREAAICIEHINRQLSGVAGETNEREKVIDATRSEQDDARGRRP